MYPSLMKLTLSGCGRCAALLGCWVAMLCIPTTALAQSVLGGFDPGANGIVYAMAVQTDGKIVVGGAFTMLGGGGTGNTPRSRIGRLNADGSLDTTFDPGADGEVRTIVVQPDGKIVVGGFFSKLGGGGSGVTSRIRIARLHADGTLDTTFDPGADSDVYVLALQADNKILVGGFFSYVGGGGSGTFPRSRIGRLNPDGSLDQGFNAGSHTNGFVFQIVVQPDGRLVIGGGFTIVGNAPGYVPRGHLARLNADGTFDPGFDPGSNGYVWSLALQPDGKILVGGEFTMLGGGGSGMTSRSRIGRLNADGSIDTGFNPGANGIVWSLVHQPDGNILAGGAFTTMGGGGTGLTTRNRIAQIDAAGVLVSGFDPGANGTVWLLNLQPNGRILACGEFTTLGGGGTGTASRSYIGRLNASGSLDGFVFSIVHSFTGTDGANPLAALKQVSDGTFYGTASEGGSNNKGTVFTVTPAGAITVLHSFAGGADGSRPMAGLLLASDANLYGTTRTGGPADKGTVFKVTPAGVVSVLHSFTGAASGGALPIGSMIQASDGNLYGSVSTGFGNSHADVGAVYKMTLAGAVTASYPFGNSSAIESRTPSSGPIQATDGALYGTYFYPVNNGGVFRMTTAGVLTFPAAFQTIDSAEAGTLVQPADGNFFGTVRQAASQMGGIFKMTPAGTITRPHTFNGGTGGARPYAGDPLIEGSDGNLYGTTELGGAFNFGTVFRMTPAGAVTILHAFTGGGNGAYPKGGLTQASDGNLYGTTSSGGGFNKGLVFRLGNPGSFTDDPLLPGATLIRAVHVTELRTRIDAVRARYGLPAYSYATDPTITAGATVIKPQHILEMRIALQEAYTAAGQTPPTYPTSPTTGSPISAADITSLRTAVSAIE
jgi:uncharacterized delta-60 repeat protein